MPAGVPPVAGADHASDVTPPTPGGAWVRLSVSASPGTAQAPALSGAQSHPSATPSASLSATTHAPDWHSPHEPQAPPSPMTVTSTVEAEEAQPPIEAIPD